MGRDFGWVAAFCQFAEFGEFSIGGGFVASLARPGGNVTGSTLVESSIAGKWLEVLKEIAPRVAIGKRRSLRDATTLTPSRWKCLASLKKLTR